MKTLSVRQPWAWALVEGWKPIENRSRRTHHRGPLNIHASLNFDKAGLEFIRDSMGIAVPDYFDCGGIVGRVNVVGVICPHGHSADLPKIYEELRDSRWFFDKFGWVVNQAQPLPFQPCKGKLGLWEFP